MPTYVFGHKNPDTDAICSALGYADFLRQTSHPDAMAARCGEITRRTDFALKQAGLEAPLLLMDVRPTAGQICRREVISASADDSLLGSFDLMRSHGLRSIPILDHEHRMLGMLSLIKMVELLLPDSADKSKARLVESSLSRINKGFSGEIQHAADLEREQVFTLLVGALSEKTFQERLRNFAPDTMLVITGDRPSVQKHALEYGARALVITGANKLSEDLLKLARKKNTAVLISPYDTATTTLLIKGAKRITHAINTDFISFPESAPLENILGVVEGSNLSLFPVVDDQQRLVGVFSKSDLIDPPRSKLVLVDHNEFGQAVNGADQAEIIEVLDHHRLGGGLTSKHPIRFINEPVGSTCTIVAMMFRRAGMVPNPSISLALAAGIIADTLHLTSPTTTATDREILGWIQSFTDTDLKGFAENFFAAGSLLQTSTADQVVRSDCKEFEENGWRFAAAQVEEQSLDDFWKHRETLATALENLRVERTLDFACLLITDITEHYSVMLVTGSEEIIGAIAYPKIDERLFELKQVVSRKKQLLPHLISAMEKARR